MDEFIFKEWNDDNYNLFINYLFTNNDDKYLEFNKKLIFTNYEMIGVRTPFLRKIAKKINKINIYKFLDQCQFNYYEEVLLYGIVISYIDDIDMFFKYFDKFILHIDNWAICDLCISSMKIVSTNKELFLNKIYEYVKNNDEFIVRGGVIILLNYYINDIYIDEIFRIVDDINMAISWLISICFIKYRDKTLKYLAKCHLNKFTYNKALQKMRESLLVSNSDKIMLQNMKIK